ncbi:hypothetical protein Hypma_002275 [Hypsizygus marmoreus]|uniref:Uncharacterized protein n=1 Tax=Hypsizygus marmoreus TaxID=39966 RepID=A0A369JZV8_HYPMA|nr:hypothetical protein Hypma_002275 [Hypsizygus marmoreus]
MLSLLSLTTYPHRLRSSMTLKQCCLIKVVSRNSIGLPSVSTAKSCFEILWTVQSDRER